VRESTTVWSHVGFFFWRQPVVGKRLISWINCLENKSTWRSPH
jgi:hypothetical protein